MRRAQITFVFIKYKIKSSFLPSSFSSSVSRKPDSRLVDACLLAYFARHQPAGQFSFSCLLNGGPQQISIPSYFKGKPVPSGPCLVTALTSLHQILAPLMSSCGYTHRFCRKDDEKATSHLKELLTKLPAQRPRMPDAPCRHATGMRTSCGGGCVCVEAP